VTVTRDVIIESSPGETRAALHEGGALTEFLVFRRTDGPRLDDIYLGRVTHIERGLEAAFVDIGMDTPGFLPLSGKTRRLAEGARVVVRITAESVSGKGPRLMADDAPPDGKSPTAVPACLRRATDLVAAAIHAFAASKPDRIVADGAATFARVRVGVRGMAPEFAARAESHPGTTPVFKHFGIEEQIERALAPRVSLASGIELHIGELEALAAIDVDAASFTPRKGARAGALAVNLAAAPDIAREIRLRNLGGLILVDFLRMKDAAERKRLIEALAALLAKDPVPVHIHGFTRAGLLELTRERRRRPLSQTLLEPGASSRKNTETVAHEALRAALRGPHPGGRTVMLAANPEVTAWLQGSGKADAAELESSLHVPLVLKSESGFPRERFEVISN
jgi:ribonuclease G